MADIKNMSSYFSALIPYIGMVEGGIVLGKDVYDHSMNPRITEIHDDLNKNEEAEPSSEEREKQNFSEEQSFEQDSQDN